MSVKITALEAENVKRIKAVAFAPSPTGLTLVGGNNNQGCLVRIKPYCT